MSPYIPHKINPDVLSFFSLNSSVSSLGILKKLSGQSKIDKYLEIALVKFLV